MHVQNGLLCRYKHQCRYQHHMATPAGEIRPGTPLNQLLELTIEHMQPLKLQQSLNCGGQLRMYGRHYQMEFYRRGGRHYQVEFFRCGSGQAHFNLRCDFVQVLAIESLLVVAGPCCHFSQATGSRQMWALCSAARAC